MDDIFVNEFIMVGSVFVCVLIYFALWPGEVKIIITMLHIKKIESERLYNLLSFTNL